MTRNPSFDEVLESLGEVLEAAPERIFWRGRDYADDGRVLDLAWGPGLALRAQVEGTAREPYRVAVWWDPTSDRWQATCSCPYEGWPCKHVVAAVLRFLDRFEAGEDLLDDPGTTGPAAAAAGDGTPPPAGARPGEPAGGPERVMASGEPARAVAASGPDRVLAPGGPDRAVPSGGSAPAPAPSPPPGPWASAPPAGSAPAGRPGSAGWRAEVDRWLERAGPEAPAGRGPQFGRDGHPGAGPQPGTDQVVVRLYFFPDGLRIAIHRARWGKQGLGKERPLPFDPLSPWLPSPAGPLHRLLFRMLEHPVPHPGRPGAATYDPLYEIPPGMVDLCLELLGRLPFVFAGDGHEPLRIEHEPYRVEVVAVPAGDDLTLTTRWFTGDGRPWSPPAGSVGIPGERYLWVQWGPVLRPVLTAGDVALHLAVGARPVTVPAAEVPDFISRYLPRLQRRARIQLPGALQQQIRDGAPRPVILLSEQEGALVVELAFAYGDGEPSIRAGDDEPALVPGGVRVWYRRRPDLERAAWDQFAAAMAAVDAGPGPDGRVRLSGDQALDFLAETLPRLAQRWEVRGQERLVRFRVSRSPLRSQVRVATGIDWLDLDVTFASPEGTAGWEALLDALQRHSRYVRLDSGVMARLPEAWLQRLGVLAEHARHHRRRRGAGGGPRSSGEEPLRLSRWAFGVAAHLLEAADRREADEGFRHLARLLDGFEGIPEMPLPRGLKARLRPYQVRGYHWLCFLRDHGLHGILADDMGLGKTVQVLALLLAEKEAGRAAAPSLVVVPTSLVFNWVEEARRFAPDLRVLALTGPRRAPLFRQAGEYDLLITTYPLIWRDIAHLEARDYHYLILDEAQHVKNPDTQTWQALRRLRARHRLALTGTPVENHVLDLWALFEILMPGYLGRQEAFVRRYAGAAAEPAPTDGRPDPRVAELRRRVFPFILRRVKDEVARDLPPRTEVVQYCEMLPAQRKLYRELLAAYRARVLAEVDRAGIARSRMTILEALLRLRQACCHPALLDLPGYRNAGSAKLEAFRELVHHVAGGGGKVLVFSQFTSMLDILQRELDRLGLGWERLDGRVRNREERVRRFQEGDVPVFLISLKAGGTGLNLTAASYVIHYDPWWNPAVEEQATGRAHRIGQDRPVFSYKLITRGTVEEKILQLQEQKRALAGALLAGDGQLGKDLTREDLEFLLAPD
ncbi:SNF2-related protein [Thermaerobacter marianensis DSM 12885]|uniref:SNF2-related protein n=1 Tax=Thermaerobacter marianensis (strain ATCC 700841 / DSM 12885 / JCM 10246 / 7p75a) TaxID=644966 RepID=E6SGV1_THEM7|nr:DEAD/DEAH box helicase [Thermaerobacter marianensis]ADU51685.1 SNF2-related protein [Thermaerobacter marianensis DSM 12885]